MKDQVQGLMTKYAKATENYVNAMAHCADATADLRVQLAPILKQIDDIEEGFAAAIKRTKDEKESLLMHLRVTADNAHRQGEFPEDKKRLPLEKGAWVQLSEKKGFKVVDPSQTVRFILGRGLEDTTIKSVTLDKDAVNAIFTLEKKFPGVEQTTTRTVSVSLPKEGK